MESAKVLEKCFWCFQKCFLRHRNKFVRIHLKQKVKLNLKIQMRIIQVHNQSAVKSIASCRDTPIKSLRI